MADNVAAGIVSESDAVVKLEVATGRVLRTKTGDAIVCASLHLTKACHLHF